MIGYVASPMPPTKTDMNATYFHPFKTAIQTISISKVECVKLLVVAKNKNERIENIKYFDF